MYKLLGIIFSLFFMISCTTTKYVEKEVPVETIKTEYVNNIRYDSIYVHDSINMYIKGDTVYKDKFKIFYKNVLKVDTVIKVDSVPKIIRLVETKTIEAKIPMYLRVFSWIGVFAILSLILLFIFKKK